MNLFFYHNFTFFGGGGGWWEPLEYNHPDLRPGQSVFKRARQSHRALADSYPRATPDRSAKEGCARPAQTPFSKRTQRREKTVPRNSRMAGPIASPKHSTEGLQENWRIPNLRSPHPIHMQSHKSIRIIASTQTHNTFYQQFAFCISG